jgi:hypothetical protein
MSLIKKNKLLFILTVLVCFMWNCATDDQQDAAKILQEKQTQDIEKEKKELNALIEKMDRLEDSLKTTYSKTIEEKKQLELRLKQIDEKEQQVFLKQKEFTEQQRQDSLQKLQFQKYSLLEKNKSLEAEKEELKSDYTIVADSLEQIKRRMADLEKQKDTILQQEKFTSSTKYKSKIRLTEDVTEIDLMLDSLDTKKLEEREKINLNEKKSSIVDKKIIALEQEKDLYELQKNDLMRQNATEEKIKEVDQQIAEIANQLQNEKTKRNQFRTNIDASKGLIQKLDTRISELRESVEKEYNEQELLGEFFDEEMNRLKEAKLKIETDNQKLLVQKENLEKEKINLEVRIAKLDTAMGILKSEDLKKIDSMMLALEKGKAKTSSEEIVKSEDKQHEQFVEPDTVLTEAEKLAVLSKKIENEKTRIDKEQAEKAKEREELLNKKAEAAEKKATRTKTLSLTIGSILLMAALVVIVLFFLGKKTRNKK